MLLVLTPVAPSRKMLPALPFEEVKLVEPDAITISPLKSDDVIDESASNVPLLCLIICGIFFSYFLKCVYSMYKYKFYE
jgi:hypothetical protein